MLSLNGRLLLAGLVVLAGFLGLTGLTLDRAFREAANTALRDRLEGHIYALLAAADLGTDAVMHLPDQLPDPRFSTPGSGLYARIVARNGSQRWRSPSAIGLRIAFRGPLPAGDREFYRLTSSDGTPLLALSFGVAWETPTGEKDFTFSVAQDLEGYDSQLRSFRHSLWGWLVGASAVLLMVQGAILRWGLAPLRRVAADLRAIESGQRTELTGRYPRELRGLTDSLNALIRHERASLERYRDTLGDLAHSLKTPLAVLRGALDATTGDRDLHQAIQESVTRMTQIVDYQLGRAATSGRTTLTAPVSVADAVRKVVVSLDKVYAEKAVTCEVDVEPGVRFFGEQGDLFEILGNLGDNAYKWCATRVAVSARRDPAPSSRRPGLVLTVCDDGPGIPAAQRPMITQRGVRADSATEGHGIGLAVVSDIVSAYGGQLSFSSSPLGGTQVTVLLPTAAARSA